MGTLKINHCVNTDKKLARHCGTCDNNLIQKMSNSDKKSSLDLALYNITRSQDKTKYFCVWNANKKQPHNKTTVSSSWNVQHAG